MNSNYCPLQLSSQPKIPTNIIQRGNGYNRHSPIKEHYGYGCDYTITIPREHQDKGKIDRNITSITVCVDGKSSRDIFNQKSAGLDFKLIDGTHVDGSSYGEIQCNYSTNNSAGDSCHYNSMTLTAPQIHISTSGKAQGANLFRGNGGKYHFSYDKDFKSLDMR
uniref:Uncharacterized protein n=1 Tax=viral metagenome TaxID=1070528 RepID=A0A6C0CZ29_9ZZZZ